MEQDLAQQQAALALLQSQAQPQAQEGLARAAEAAAHGQAQAAERRGPKPKDGPTGNNPQGGPAPEATSRPAASATEAACAADADVLDTLIAEVSGLSGNDQSLLSKLEAAKAALSRCQTQAAQGQLQAFLNQLNALRRSCDLTDANYAALFNQAARALTVATGASASDLPAAVSAPQCETAPAPSASDNKPESPGPPPDRGRP
jgi:hypothetical protein